jgi:quercetin dioxygenase-like cupin family protein
VLTGSVEVRTEDESWALGVGDLIAIPPKRHSVHASTDAAFVLTVSLP